MRFRRRGVKIGASGLALGPDHPEVMRSASALGHVLMLARGSSAAWNEAKALLSMALAKQLKLLGPKHAETLRTESRLKAATVPPPPN